MSNNRKVKIESILESQIPKFLSLDSPLFQEFLKQYYISQTHFTGILDIANHLNEYKNIDTYSSERVYTTISGKECFLIENLNFFENTIQVNSTMGFPDKYGLLQIDDEIITYTGTTENTFTGCVRGFSGISEIKDIPDSSGLVFSITNSADHSSKTIVKNLNLIFYSKLFEKFKYQYLPDFEGREFNENISLDLILSRARDFYLTKGSDISFKILFDVLYGDVITLHKPKEQIIKSSSGVNISLKSILVEIMEGNFTPSDLIGLTLFQNISDNIIASASVYNTQIRPIDEMFLYEISLDSDSFIYNFVSTNTTKITEKITNTNTTSNYLGSLFVESTIGFPTSGTLYVKIKNLDNSYSIKTINYSGKTINQFLNISGITSEEYSIIEYGDIVIDDKLASVTLDDGSVVTFRILNVIENFDFTNTNLAQVNDLITVTSFGENFEKEPEYLSWIYNYPTYHEIKSINPLGEIVLYENIPFRIKEEVELIDKYGNINVSSIVLIDSDSNKIKVDASNIASIESKTKIKKIINKSPLNLSSPTFIENTYINTKNNNLVVMSSGLPDYKGEINYNKYIFDLVGTGDIFTTISIENNNPIYHNFISGTRIYLNSNSSLVPSGQYFIRKINETSISLYKSTGDLYLSFSPNSNQNINPITLNTTSNDYIIGRIILFDYKDSISFGFQNQLLLKEFTVTETLKENKILFGSQIYNIEDAYNEFKS